MASPMCIVALDALKSLVFHCFGMRKGLPDFSENPQGGVRGIRIAVRYIGFISMFYGCYSSETMKSIPICIPIISVKIDVVHRREYCVFCG